MERKRRGIVNKECKECGFQGKPNVEGICKSCEEVEDQEGRKVCKQCKEVSNEDDGIQCDNCGNWCHAECEDLSKLLFKELHKDTSMLWFCKSCNPKVITYLDEAKKLKDDNNEMKNELRELKEENVEAMKKVPAIENASKSEDKNTNDSNKEIREELKILKKQMALFQQKIENLDKK